MQESMQGCTMSELALLVNSSNSCVNSALAIPSMGATVGVIHYGHTYIIRITVHY